MVDFGCLGLHITYNPRTVSDRVKHRRGPALDVPQLVFEMFNYEMPGRNATDGPALSDDNFDIGR